MLYGMEDDYDKEFGQLIKKEKSKKNKIMLIVAIIIACILVIYASFSISYHFINKKVDLSQNNMSNVNNNNSDEKKSTLTKKNAKVYNGEHTQIAIHDMEKIKTKFIPQPNENAQNLIKEIYKSDEKQLYLPFDDGTSKKITPQILDILKQYDVKATFFLLGSRVELYPDLVKREFEEGHYIANHGYSHKYSQIYQSKDTTFAEYVQCENAIKNVLGNPDYNSYLFRFPGGSSGGKYEEVKSQARELFNTYGVAYTNWNCLTGDAENKKTKEECIQEMINTKNNQNSIILLMHDANDKQQTVDALPEIIQYFKNEGYTFKNFYEIFK